MRRLLFFLCLSCWAAEPRLRFGPLDGARFGLDLDGHTHWASGASSISATSDGWTLRFDQPGIVWSIRVRRRPDGASAVIGSTIRNAGSKPVRLGRCRLADLTDSASRLDLGEGAEKAVLLVHSGWAAGSAVRAVRGDKHHFPRTIAQFYNPAARRAVQLAFLTFDRAHTEHEVWWDEQRNRPVASSYCDFLGFALQPGKSIDSEELAVSAGNDPIAALRHWGDQVNARYRPAIWPRSPAGWVGWSWADGIYSERYEDVLRRNVAAMRERIPGSDLEYIWVSIGNLQGQVPGNWLRWNSKLFPSPPEKLVADLGAAGFKLGLWVAPFWLGKTPEEASLRETFMLSDGKPLIVPRTDVGDTFVLDPTHPKTQAFLRDVFSTYRRWGIRYYMVDFLNAVSGPVPGSFKLDGYHDKGLVPGVEAMRAGLKVVREAVGPDTYLLSSTGPTIQLTGLMNASRTGNDYGEGRPLYGPGKWYYPATYIINKFDQWQAPRYATQALATSFFMHRKLFLADTGNVLTVDKPLPLDDARIAATIFGINGGPMMLGDDIARIAPERLELIRMALPRLPEAADPVDLFDAVEGFAQHFRLRVERPWDRWDLVALFNYGDQPLTRRLELDPARPQVAWDFWNERYLGVRSASLTASVAPRSVVLLRLAAAREHPWILSTDMHLRQGQAEIEDCVWDAQKLTLTFTAARPQRSRGNVYIRAPKGFALRDIAGLWVAKDGNDQSLVIRCALDFTRSARQTRTLAFIKV